MKKTALIAATAVIALSAFAMPAHADTTQTTSRTTTTDTTTYAPRPVATTQVQPMSNNSHGVFGPLTGIYAGGFGGYNSSTFHRSGPDTSPMGGDYGVFAGYSLDSLLTQTGIGITGAIEGQYSWSDAEDHTKVAGAPFRTRKKNDWGVSFRPGLTFIDQYTPFGLKPYGIIGYRRADFDNNTRGSSNSTHLNGTEVGIGTEVLAYQQFGVRLDYSHVFYGLKNNGQSADENDLRLGVAYHF